MATRAGGVKREDRAGSISLKSAPHGRKKPGNYGRRSEWHRGGEIIRRRMGSGRVGGGSASRLGKREPDLVSGTNGWFGLGSNQLYLRAISKPEAYDST